MFDAALDKRLGLQPLRFAVGCVIIFATLAIVLNLRRFGLILVLRTAVPAATLAAALVWLKADDLKISRRLGNGILTFMFVASLADIVWSIFLP